VIRGGGGGGGGGGSGDDTNTMLCEVREARFYVGGGLVRSRTFPPLTSRLR